LDLTPFPKAVTWVKLFGEFVYCPSCGGLAYLGVAEGLRHLFVGMRWGGFSSAGGSLGGSSAAFCGYASWLAWWWISGVSMGIPSSLLSSVFLSVVGVAECGFSPRRRWSPSSRRRCGVEIGAAALLALFLAALAAGLLSAVGGLRGALPGWLAAWGRGGPGGWPCAAALPST